MSNLITRTARLVPYAKRPKQVSSFVMAYSYEPLPDEPIAQLGSIYVVMEVLVSGRASEETATLILETLEDQYYAEANKEHPALDRFENAIKAVNHELSEHVNHGNASWIGKISALIAVQSDTELHVAQTGSAEALLYRGKSSTRIGASSNNNRPLTPSKTFGSIASGELEPGDRLLLATPALIHQVPLQRLSKIVANSGPNASISEITELLQGASTERIAALVVEITTPEMAALQVRSEHPSEIQLGAPENLLEAAKVAAIPVTQTTVAGSKKVARAAKTRWNKTMPYMQHTLQITTGRLREFFTHKRNGRWAIVGLGGLLILAGSFTWQGVKTSNAHQAMESYRTAYMAFKTGQNEYDNGQTQAARTTLGKAKQQLTVLGAQTKLIDKTLSSTQLEPAQPDTLAGLQALISTRLDQIDGLVKAEATTIASWDTKAATPKHFEVIGSKAYVFGTDKKQSLSIINLASGAVGNSKADFSGISDEIIATTASGTNDGVYILTAKPSVWFYRVDTDRLTEQIVSYGNWPKANAISSYLSNLYLLSGDTVYKHTKSATSFSPAVTSLNLDKSPAKGASALAVDGSIYIITNSQLHQYLSGALKQTTLVPPSFLKGTILRTTPGGDVILGVSPDANRIGLWTNQGNKLTFNKQIELRDTKQLLDADYDSKDGFLYALVDNRFVRVTVKP